MSHAMTYLNLLFGFAAGFGVGTMTALVVLLVKMLKHNSWPSHGKKL